MFLLWFVKQAKMSATDLRAINVILVFFFFSRVAEKQSLTQFSLLPRGILMFSVTSPANTESAFASQRSSKREAHTDSVSALHSEYRKDLNRTITSLVLSKGRQEIIFATLDTFRCECFLIYRWQSWKCCHHLGPCSLEADIWTRALNPPMTVCSATSSALSPFTLSLSRLSFLPLRPLGVIVG